MSIAVSSSAGDQFSIRGMQQPPHTDLLARTLAQVDDWPVDSVAAGLIDQGKTYYAGTVDTDYRFPLASVTKPLVAYAVAVAVEEGVFEWDTACGPEGSTVRHLLAHASGVGFDTPEPQKPVGQRRIYSSAGFELLADAVEAETGIAFPEYFRQALCEPLGFGATLDGSAGHGVTASLRDVMTFVKEVLQPSLIHPSTLEEMLSIQYPELAGVVPGYGSFTPCPWGLGFEVKGSKGTAGSPGELKGRFLSAHAIGTIRINGENGVYGTTRTHFSGQLREIAFAQEVVTGPAEIWATIEGETPRAYRIQIERVSDADPRRNLVIRVTDPSLLSATGGIVQGMSGSPILQNGRLVGAVTHVLVNDPTRGYGIFAQTMLEQAKNAVQNGAEAQTAG